MLFHLKNFLILKMPMYKCNKLILYVYKTWFYVHIISVFNLQLKCKFTY